MTPKLPIHNFEDFRQILFDFRLPRMILTALELGVFTVMGRRSWTVGTLAKTLRCSERGIDILCRNLASSGLLIKCGPRYSNSQLGQTILNRQSPLSRHDYLKLIEQQWEDWSFLTRAVKSGKPVEMGRKDDLKHRRSFTWAMHQRSLESAKQVAGQMNFRNVRSLLDVGGGPGTYALEFLSKNPQLYCTLWDRKGAIQVARKIAHSLPHGSRMNFCVGDFFEGKVPGQFDIIWISNVIHIYSPEENRSLFRKLNQALNPGGRLIIQDTFTVDQAGLHPIETNLFAGTMLLFTQTGNTYSTQEVKKWLKATGYGKGELIRLKKGTGDWDGILIQGIQRKRSKTE